MALVGGIYNPTFLYYKDLQSEIKKIHFKNRICYWIKNPKNTRTGIANPSGGAKLYKFKEESISEGTGDDCGIFFIHCSSGKTYKIPRTDIVLNDPSLLLIFVPENMEKGEYELKISTGYNGLQKELKRCRTTVFEKKLVIGKL